MAIVFRSIFLFFMFSSVITCAQTFNLTGRVLDSKDTSTLVGVSVMVTKQADSNSKTGTVTDLDGYFTVTNLAAGSYNVTFDYIGYKLQSKQVMISTADVVLGTVKMTSTSNELKSVTIKDKEIRATQLGDTSQFNASAYKTHPDATAEDLVTKMPGVTSDNNGVKVNGENLQQVYVDGKPFFGNDPTAALKNMPSEIIDKIQIFDKLSDQAAFTGFDDGSAQKTMNIITKGNKREGQFGKVYAGYGTDNTYSLGGNINFFKGDRRITIVGLSNNINQQNFSAQDLLGVTAGSGGNRGGGGGGGRGSFGGGGGNGGGANNFFVGQQNGITATNSFGFNYSDNWGKKLKVSGSYFFNSTDNTSNSDLVRNYFDTTRLISDNIYSEFDTSETRNSNHRVNLRFEYTIDSFNTVIFTPGISFQTNDNNTHQFANQEKGDTLLTQTHNYNSADNSGYSSTDNLLLQHKFRKQRRTISLNISSTLNEKNGTGVYWSHNINHSIADSLDQHNAIYNNGYTLSPNVTYTEPVGKKGQLLVTYNPSFSKSSTDKETDDRNVSNNEYTSLDTQLSNKYNTTYNTQKGGVSYRVGDKKMTFNIGANMQYATLEGEQIFPYTFSVNRSFTSILPNAMFNYRYADGRNLRIMYRTNTAAPSVTQLQSVVDVSNPLLLKTGNPLLDQDYEHTLIVRYGLTKSKTGRNFFLNLYANYIDNYIGNSTIQPLTHDIKFKEEHMQDSVLIRQGTQLTLPVNVNGYFNERAFATYGFPVSLIKSNLNLNGGFNFTRTPGEINNALNYSNNFAPSWGIVLGSNISEKLDFTLSYSGSYNYVNNTLQSSVASKYYSHTAAFKVNYNLLKNIVLNTNITHNYYSAFSSTGNQSYFLWNAYVGYKMLKSKLLEARITAFDILNQNRSITRTVTDNYIENNNTKVLQQYFMFQLTYTIRNFKGQLPEFNEKENDMRGQWRGQGGPGGHGGFPRGGE